MNERQGIKDRLSNPLCNLIIIITATLIAIFTMAVLMEMRKRGGAKEEVTSSEPPKPRKVCDSPECITLSYQLLNWREPSIDPCDDFYQATCGKYTKESTVTSRTTKIEDQLAKNSTSKMDNILRQYYQKCEKLKNTENSQDQSYQDILKEIRKIGSWPMIDKEWDESKFDLNEMLSNLEKAMNFENSDATWIQDKNFRKILKNLLKIEKIDMDPEEELKEVEDFLNSNLTIFEVNLKEKLPSSPRTISNLLILKFISETTENFPADPASWAKIDCPKTIMDLFPIYNIENQDKKIVEEIFENIRGILMEMVNGSTWNEESKKNGVEKLENLGLRWEEVEEEFEKLTISTDDSWYTLTAKATKLRPLSDPIFYNSSENILSIWSIVPISSSGYPKSVEYAQVGTILAKDIAKSLEIPGKGCLEVKVSVLGAEAIWQIYKKLDLSEEEMIPGFQESDQDKLFYYIYASNFCSSDSSHNINKILANTKSFSDIFNCPIGSKMNPNDKCDVL